MTKENQKKYPQKLIVDSDIALQTNDESRWFQIYYHEKYIGHIVLDEQFVFGQPRPKEKCAIWDMRIIKEHKKRMGIGTKVYQFIEENYLKPYCDNVTLNATPDGAPFWLKMGYEWKGLYGESMIKSYKK